MTWSPPSHSPYPWHDAPTADTPLDASHLMAAENDLIAFAQSIGTSLDAYLEGLLQLAPTAVKSTGYTFAANDYVPVDATGGAAALVLPTAPADRTRCGLKITGQATVPNQVSVTCGGADVFNKAGGSVTLSFYAKNTSVLFQYKASSGIWYVLSTDTPLGQPLGAAQLGTDGLLGTTGKGGSQLPAPVLNGSALATTAGASRKLERANNPVGSAESWCWFNGPGVIDHKGTVNGRYIGSIASDGSVLIKQLNLDTGVVTQFNLHAGYSNFGGFPANDHASPAIVIRPDGRIAVFYAQQGNAPIQLRVSTNPEDITSFAAEQTITNENSATYPHPFYLGTRLYLFYSSVNWRIRYSDDGGATWSAPILWHTPYPNPGMYLVMNSNGSRIDWTISMHPDATGPSYAALSSMYHAYLDSSGMFRKSDGTAIQTLASLPTITTPDLNNASLAGGIPITSLTKVYDYTTNGPSWTWDIAYDASGNPVTVFASFPLVNQGDTYLTALAHFTDHRYNYYRWNGAAWVGGQITPGGSFIGNNPDSLLYASDSTYSGGVALSQDDPTIVFLSRQVAPANQFEIERWVTTDGFGASWTSTPLTVESGPLTANIRPLTPRNPTPGGPEVHWLTGAWQDYTVFSTKIAVAPTPATGQVRGALTARPAGAGLVDQLAAPAIAVAPKLLLPLAADLLDISGNTLHAIPQVSPVFGAGRYGDRKALTFDGATQGLEVGGPIAYSPFTAGTVRTYFGWAKRTNHSAAHALLGGTLAAASHHPLLRLQPGSQDVYFTGDVATAGATWTAAWPGDGVWAHWALIHDDVAHTVELFINGVSKGQVAQSIPYTAGNNLLIGCRVKTVDRFNGSMALFGVAEQALTPTQIAQMAGSVTGARNGNPAVASIIAQLLKEGQLGADNTTPGTSGSTTQIDALIAPAIAAGPGILLPLAGDLNDVTANARNGTMVGTEVHGAGRYGLVKALTLDGATQWVTTGYQPFAAASTRTFFGLANRTNHSAAHALMGGTVNAGSHYPLLRLESGSQNVNFWTDVATDTPSRSWTAAWPGDGVWVAWALVVISGTSAELFINGVSQGVKTSTFDYTAANSLMIGAAAGTNPFNGSIGLFGVVESALTPTQIRQIHGAVGDPGTLMVATGEAMTRVSEPSRDQQRYKARGILTETVAIMDDASAATSALTSGTVVDCLAGFLGVDVVTGVIFDSTAPASVTLVKVGLRSKAGVLLASSADFSASLVSGVNPVPFTAPYTLPIADGYYLEVLMVFSGTAPQLHRVGLSSLLGVSLNGGAKPSVQLAGQSDLPASSLSFVGGTVGWWLAAY